MRTPESPTAERVDRARRRASQRLRVVSETPLLDAELLLCAVLGVERVALLTDGDRLLSDDERERFHALIERRLAGEPVAYITGQKGFRRIELSVDPRVLIPRPETERLVEIGLAAIEDRPGPRTIVDVGTGSGAVALALADELGPDRSDVRIVATDVDPQALAVARENRQRLGLDQRVELVEADLLDGLSGPVDIILANLPYLRDDQRHPSIRREPEVALFAGVDGFDCYRELLPQARSLLDPHGLLAIEIDPDQAALATRELEATFGMKPAIEEDLAGHLRIAIVDLAPR